jgi:hypothetical protein
MFKGFKRFFSNDPFQFMKKLEKPIVETYERVTLNYPFKSSTPITKVMINSSILIYMCW